MFLRLPLLLYEMYIKYVCNMHMLTVDGTHTYDIEGHSTVFWYSLFHNMSRAEMWDCCSYVSRSDDPCFHILN